MRTWDYTKGVEVDQSTARRAVCGEGVLLEEAHSLHHPSCPSHTQPNWSCDCEIWVHAEHCPECAERR